VRIAFGLEEFTDGSGLYIAYRENETFTLEDRFHYTAKTRGTNLIMGYFSLHGFRFYLNLEATARKYDRIEDSDVFYREAHFVDPVATVRAEPIASIESLIRAERARRMFRQKISIVWPQTSLSPEKSARRQESGPLTVFPNGSRHARFSRTNRCSYPEAELNECIACSHQLRLT
jgi:hypothetical protein